MHDKLSQSIFFIIFTRGVARNLVKIKNISTLIFFQKMNESRENKLGFVLADTNYCYIDPSPLESEDEETHENKEFPSDDLAKLREIYHVFINVSFFSPSNCHCGLFECHHRVTYQVLQVELPSYFSFDFMDNDGMYDDSNFKEDVKSEYKCYTVGCAQVKKKPRQKTEMMELLGKV